MTKTILSIFLFLSISFQAFAVYDINDNCKNAWMLLMELEIDRAKELLAEEIEENPDNYYAYYIDQTCDAYALLINSGDKDYEVFVENYYKKREIMDDHDIDSPYYLSCSAEMELQVGIFNIINSSILSGLKKAYSSYRNIYRNLDQYPDFGPCIKMDGFFNVAISNLPPFVKWAASFFGVTSDIDYGFKLLKQNYLANKDIVGINAESALFVILAAKINKTPEMVYDFSRSLDSSVSQTFIHSYFRSNISFRIGKNEEAYNILKQIDISDYPSADMIYSYMMGKILLRKLDPNASYYLERYLSYLEKKEYVKEINYNLALYHLIINDPDSYYEYCDIVKNEGIELNERDREALYDANLDYAPDINLVKARLLLDGGYYSGYEDAMKSYKANSNENLPYKLEFLFLSARYNAESSNIELAIVQFRKVIELGEDEDYYFASEAALRLGNIYREKGEFKLAKGYYKKSMELYKNDYYEYIEDKAAKGFNSVKYSGLS